MHESHTEGYRVLTRILGRLGFGGIGKNQNLGTTKRILNINEILEALRVSWQDLGLKLLVGFWGGGQNTVSSDFFKVFKARK